MVFASSQALSSVIESEDSLHLSLYIKFNGDMNAFKVQLEDFLINAESHLRPVMKAAQIRQFLSPVRALAHDTITISQLSKSIGIFRRNDYLSVVSLPLDVVESCVVASTFHIKPLIKWAQFDQEFSLIALCSEGARIFRGSQSDFREVDFLPISGSLERFLDLVSQNSNSQTLIEERQFNHSLGILVRALREVTGENSNRVFLIGADGLLREFEGSLSTQNFFPSNLLYAGSDTEITEICRRIRESLSTEATKRFSEAILEFENALQTGEGKTNLFQIAKAAVKGNVQKLIIAEDFNIFGKLNRNTGGVILHPIDLDHEDDCLLDDLAQTVLLSGGEVLIAKREQIPNKRPIVAIMKNKKGGAGRLFAPNPRLAV